MSILGVILMVLLLGYLAILRACTQLLERDEVHRAVCQ